MENKQKKEIVGLIYIALMGFNYPMLKYLSSEFSTFNNNGIRFLAGGIFLLLISIIKYKEDLVKFIKNKKLLFDMSIMSVLACLYMYFLMSGLSYTTSLTASIFSILSMPLGLVVAGFVFIDERNKIKNLRFVVGTTIAMVASIMFVVYTKTDSVSNNFMLGSLFLFISMTALSIQNIFLKIMSREIHPTVISAILSLIIGIVFTIFSIITNDILQVKEASSFLLFLTIFSGIYGIITGLLYGLNILKDFGIVVYNIFQLLIPISTSVVAYIFLNENISLMQILSGIIVILACLIALKEKKEDILKD